MDTPKTDCHLLSKYMIGVINQSSNKRIRTTEENGSYVGVEPASFDV